MSTTHEPDLTIPRRFCGPPSSANGGYTSGSLAERILGEPTPVVEVTLRRPPPLDTPMAVRREGDLTMLLAEAATVAEARCTEADLEPVEAVSRDDAAAAERLFLGLRSHPFPTCFSCGPRRSEGDGLRIFPGSVGAARVAATWTPHPSLAEVSDVLPPDEGQQRVGLATAWAALDCIGGWSSDLEGRPAVLGRMTAQVDTRPVVGEPHVVVGQELRVEGRKTFTASTLYDSDSRIVGRAAHVWIAVDPAAFG